MSKQRVKMPVQERAKQFAPFSPLKGLTAALMRRERQRVLVDKKLVSQDLAAENDRVLHLLAPGVMAEAVYYDNGEYIKKRGLVAEISARKKYVKIVDTVVGFEDLFEIKIG
ncbi:MAG: YolD-like family protein [Clostridia bacterium]|nr:YolD-like family protein [Clostridia bacterium]